MIRLHHGAALRRLQNRDQRNLVIGIRPRRTPRAVPRAPGSNCPRPAKRRGDVMTRKIVVATGLALLLLFGAGVAFAQGSLTGSLQGNVKDDQGVGIPGVRVTASSSALVRGKTSTTTDAA